jgi:predicted DNA-binding ArsR family transcriptional regulator
VTTFPFSALGRVETVVTHLVILYIYHTTYTILLSYHPPTMTLPDLCSTFEPAFFLKDQKLKDIVEQFKKEMKEGLEDYGKDMAMVPSFVTGVPDGSEEGCVYF